MADFGCRLSSQTLESDLEFFSSSPFIEEPISRSSSSSLINYDLPQLGFGENCIYLNDILNLESIYGQNNLLQPDMNLLSPYDLRTYKVLRPGCKISMHNWISPVSCLHNYCTGISLQALYFEWPVIDNPFYRFFDLNLINKNIESFETLPFEFLKFLKTSKSLNSQVLKLSPQ